LKGIEEQSIAVYFLLALGENFLESTVSSMPTASERLVWGFGDGSTLPVFDTPIGRVGTSNSGLDLLQAFYFKPTQRVMMFHESRI
jgi:hypothetical protein